MPGLFQEDLERSGSCRFAEKFPPFFILRTLGKCLLRRKGGRRRGEAECVWGVGVEAPGLDGQGDETAGDGEDVAGFMPVLESGPDEFRGIEDGPGGAAGDQGAVVEVGAVEEAFGEEGNSATLAHGFDGASRKADGSDAWETSGEDFDEDFGGVGVFLGVVVERAVQLDVGERDGRRGG